MNTFLAFIAKWFKSLLDSLEKSGMERARRQIEQHGYGRWE